jgi:hypothetical protein
MTAVDHVLDQLGTWIARRLTDQPGRHGAYIYTETAALKAVLQPGDVLLVDGHERVSTAIKFLTQSTWSHAALFVGQELACARDGEPCTLVEANLGQGVVAAPLSKYQHNSVRICRPFGLTAEDRSKVIEFVIDRIGISYDLRNVLDLARYLIPTPPVPRRFRRRMIALGSGEPTRAICSTLIAQAFESVRYPILPRIEKVERSDCDICPISTAEVLHIRHHSLYAPCDFDLSPYFQVVKPAMAASRGVV